MALPGTGDRIQEVTELSQRRDLKAITMPFSYLAPGGVWSGIQLLSTFVAQRTYILTACHYSLRPSSMYVLNYKVALTDDPLAVAQPYTVGTTILDVQTYGGWGDPQFPGLTASGFLNWVPNGWYIPIGGKIGTFIDTYSPAAAAWQGGSVTLYLLETFEQ